MIPSDSPDIPFVDFTDVDRDGMMDMIFFHEGKIYTYYNMHSHVDFEGGATLSELYLCKKWNETEAGPIFADYKDVLANKFTEHVMIQDLNLKKRDGGFLEDDENINDIVTPFFSLRQKFPGRIRTADINIDGYPDIFVTFEIVSPEKGIQNKAYPLMNFPCTDKTP